MSDGGVCVCRHYKPHHETRAFQNDKGRCLFEWRGKTCDCKVFKDDGRATQTLRDLFERAGKL